MNANVLILAFIGITTVVLATFLPYANEPGSIAHKAGEGGMALIVAAVTLATQGVVQKPPTPKVPDVTGRPPG